MENLEDKAIEQLRKRIHKQVEDSLKSGEEKSLLEITCELEPDCDMQIIVGIKRKFDKE